jgi:ATP-dependent helicase Lhr and Lhr-like helicase
MPDSAFDLLAPPIQECLWRMGWTGLRPIQARAIHAVLQSENDLIVSARTASGKTEAAFLPILSKLAVDPPSSVGVLYVGPLKALINDQFRRLEELCEFAEIPVHRRHGDVGEAAKNRLMEQPSGIVLITPESLESLFINRSSSIARLFRDLRYVVIDELHAFVGRERGLHLRSLLFRLEQRIQHPYRMVALSATLGDWSDSYADWLRPGRAQQVTVVTDSGESRAVRFKIYAYELGRSDGPSEPTERPSDNDDQRGLFDDMLQAFGGRKNLIFANRKDQVEWVADALNERCRKAGRLEEFLVHHGSVSKDIREHTEHLMREDSPHTTVCSSTLELGIDIGKVAAVGQIGVPWSVSSMVQRLGRSGRGEGEHAELRMYVEDFSLDDENNVIDRLHPKLLQAIALTELMLQKWIEPPNLREHDHSTLIQQILSVLAETGGVSAAALFGRLASRGAFQWLDAESFTALLRSLGARDLIEQAAEGSLILGIEGERIVKSFEFYSAFASQREYDVLHSAHLIGSLPAVDPPPVGEHLLLGGRRWQVAGVDTDQEEIYVVPASGRKRPFFGGSAGDIHSIVRQKMRDVVLGDQPITYLNSTASLWLSHARKIATAANLNTGVWFDQSANRCLLFTWLGTRTQRTIVLLAKSAGLDASDADIAIEFSGDSQHVRSRLRPLLLQRPTSLELAARTPFKERRKYDRFLTAELLTASVAHDALDVEEAFECLCRSV